jgi:hypothetical protein
MVQVPVKWRGVVGFTDCSFAMLEG